MKTLDECRINILDFAKQHDITYEETGECGFGRECVGLSKYGKYIDYNPVQYPNFENVPDFYNESFYDITPADAYHKHDCLAVLGRGEEAIAQLSEWVDKLKELDVAIEEYSTGATGAQALFSGTISYAIKIKK